LTRRPRAGITRRDFLDGVAITAAGLAAAEYCRERARAVTTGANASRMLKRYPGPYIAWP